MIVVSGVMRSGTTWLARRIGDLTGRRVAQEPLNPNWEWHGDYHEMPEPLRERVTQLQGYMHRHEGHHEVTPRGGTASSLRDLFLALGDAYPGARVLKLMHFPYWGAMLSAWPDLRVVYVVRRPQSWLSSVLRTPYMAHRIVTADWGCPTPWREAGDELAQCLAFRAQTLAVHLRTLQAELPPERFLLVDYEALSATAEVEAWRVADFCDCDAGPLEAWTRVPERSWEGRPWGAWSVVGACSNLMLLASALASCGADLMQGVV